jgi:hypothetical protein
MVFMIDSFHGKENPRHNLLTGGSRTGIGGRLAPPEIPPPTAASTASASSAGLSACSSGLCLAAVVKLLPRTDKESLGTTTRLHKPEADGLILGVLGQRSSVGISGAVLRVPDLLEQDRAQQLDDPRSRHLKRKQRWRGVQRMSSRACPNAFLATRILWTNCQESSQPACGTEKAS